MSVYKITMAKQPKWSNPKCIKVDIDFPVADTTDLTCPGKSSRVMPLNKMGKFFTLLRRKTKTFKSADISHYWVSGYIQLEFDLRSVNDRKKIKGLVKECIINSGGFMTLDQWLEKHHTQKKKCKIFAFAGTGSGIIGGQINTNYEYL